MKHKVERAPEVLPIVQGFEGLHLVTVAACEVGDAKTAKVQARRAETSNETHISE